MKRYLALGLIMIVMLSACGAQGDKTESNLVEETAEKSDDTSTKTDATTTTSKSDAVTTTTKTVATANKEPETLLFRDVYGVEYETVINPNVAKNPFKDELFVHSGDHLSYNDANYETLLGVDVSHHQGKIDWNKVKSAGYDFAILRIGYRGYGSEGAVNADRTFAQNYEQAKAAGLKVGVYFFAQAINEKEAQEEADFVLGILRGRELDLPVTYDPESILDDVARTDNVSGEQFTANTKVFCNAIQRAGYQPMIYSNMLWEAFELDLEQLSEFPIWYADYEPVPQTPYNFVCWQYSNEGKVDGINGVTDLNIWLEKK